MPIGRERADVVVVTGAGGMGAAVARRLGSGRQLVLADRDEDLLERVGAALRGEGHRVRAVPTDVSRQTDVERLAATAGDLGQVVTVVHTAGVSPVQADAARVVSVDVLGTAYLLDAFLEHATPGMVVVCVASMAGVMVPQPPEVERALALTPASELAALPALDPAGLVPELAYPLAKRANQLRVEAVATAYGRRGARVLSVSPGVISTPMGQAELDGPSGEVMRGLVQASGTGRLGTPDDIADVVAFLASPAASFITGTDLLVDGGVVAAMRWPS